MAAHSNFTKDRPVYWTEEFSGVVNLLTGRDEQERFVSPPLYQYNTGAITLAACIGLKEGRKRELGSGKRKEINTSTFSAHRLEEYIFLIPLLGKHPLGVELLRPDNEDEAIREFERYACGGLEFLSGVFDASAGKSPDVLLQSLMTGSQGANRQPVPLPKLFG